MIDTVLDRFVENIVSGLSDCEMCLFIEMIPDHIRKKNSGKQGKRQKGL